MVISIGKKETFFLFQIHSYTQTGIKKKGFIEIFSCDNKTEIRPSLSIINSSEDIYEGNTITLVYGMEQMEAKIIKLSGKKCYTVL